MKIEETVREDGLWIITCRIPAKKVYMEISAGVGSAYDPPHHNGLFHLFEHMAFRGTAQRSAQEMTSFIRKNLLASGAYTEKLRTVYYGTSVTKKLIPLTELLCDIYCNSCFPEKELSKEKEVVLNEIARDNDQDGYVAFVELWKQLWRANPLRVHGVGTPEGIAEITQEQLCDAHQCWYIPSNTVVIVAGNVHHQQIVAMLDRLILRRHGDVAPQLWDDECAVFPTTQTINIQRPGREKAIVVTGAKCPPCHDERSYAIGRFFEYVLQWYVFDEFVQKMGISYHTSVSYHFAQPLGNYFSFLVETLPDRIPLVRERLSSLLYAPFTDMQFFAEMKERYLDFLTLGFAEPQDVAVPVHRYLVMGTPLKQLEHYLAERRRIISRLTLGEIEEFRKTLFVPKKFVTVTVQP